MIELWKPIHIEPFNEAYEVSNLGRIKRIKKGPGTYIGKILNPFFNPDGYKMIDLMYKGHRKTVTMHRLVAIAFIINSKENPEINHIDCDKTNNCINNLEWCTHLENMRHSFKNNLRDTAKGIAHGNSKFTEKQIKEIRKTYKRGSHDFGIVAIAKKYNVWPTTIYKIVNNKAWTHI